MNRSKAPVGALLGCLLLTSPASLAADRFDHRGAVGLLLGSGFELGELVHGGQFDEYQRGVAELGLSVAVGENGNEFKAVVQAGRRGALEWSAFGGYRGYFGQERLKTFFDLDLAFDLRPDFTAGPRLAFGAQYELHPLIGVFAGLDARLGIGSPTRFSAGAFAGFQFRSYLLE
jgi:hypothetical protein